MCGSAERLGLVCPIVHMVCRHSPPSGFRINVHAQELTTPAFLAELDNLECADAVDISDLRDGSIVTEKRREIPDIRDGIEHCFAE